MFIGCVSKPDVFIDAIAIYRGKLGAVISNFFGQVKTIFQGNDRLELLSEEIEKMRESCMK
jgi:hypothetical protein